MRHALVVAFLTLAACSTKDPITADVTLVKDGGPNEVHDPSPAPTNTSDPGPGPISGDDTQISGSRIKRRVYKGSDGSQNFVGWYDSQRGENCEFRKMTDDKVRCIPGEKFWSTAYYSDECVTPLVHLPKGCTKDSYVLVYEACSLISNVKKVGVPFTGPTVYMKSGAGCSSTTTANVTGGTDLFIDDGDVPLTSFIEATEEKL